MTAVFEDDGRPSFLDVDLLRLVLVRLVLVNLAFDKPVLDGCSQLCPQKAVDVRDDA